MWSFRRLGKISWTQKITNKEMCNSLSVSLVCFINIIITHTKQEIKYFEHLGRHDILCQHVLERKAKGKEQRGSQQLMRTDDIKN